MLLCPWVITFAFPFPANCTREVLLGLLHSYANEWLGWERFPWRITRDLHHFIDDPPVEFPLPADPALHDGVCVSRGAFGEVHEPG